MRKIFHLETKADNSHKYYGSLSALCSENPNLGVSKFTLDRFDFSEPFENATCIIRKSVMKTTGSVGEKKNKTLPQMSNKIVFSEMDGSIACNGKALAMCRNRKTKVQ